MLEKYEAVVPINVAADISAGTVLEWDDTSGYYTPLASGEPVGILKEAVTAGQSPATAKVQFMGIVYEDELQGTVTESLKAKLRKVGIFVESRTEA